MSTHFVGEGDIGSAPDDREFPNGNHEPRRLLRVNVYLDNPIPRKDGEEGHGGFWAPVELHRDAEPRCKKGMRVLVEGRTVRDKGEDANKNERVTFKVDARRVGILRYRVDAVTLSAKPAGGQSSLFSTTATPLSPKQSAWVAQLVQQYSGATLAIMLAPSPQCPQCGAPMRQRIGKSGGFYPCSRYPDCKGTQPIETSEGQRGASRRRCASSRSS